MVKLFSSHSVFSVLSDLAVNLSSGWFGVLLISPGFFGASKLPDYVRLLTNNLPSAIVGLLLAMWLREKERKL